MPLLPQGTTMEDYSEGEGETTAWNSFMRKKILDLLEKGPVSTKEIAEHLDRSLAGARNHLKKLEQEGVIVRRCSLEDARVRVWQLHR